MITLSSCILSSPPVLSRLELNGWDHLDRLEDLSRTDLEYLGVTDMKEQDKLLGAVASLAQGQEEWRRRDSLGSSSSQRVMTNNESI